MEKIVHRYSAHFPRWCQALGDHVPDPGGEARAVEWLVGVDCVGVIVLPEIRHLLTHGLLGAKTPELEFCARSPRLNQRGLRGSKALSKNNLNICGDWPMV